MNPPAKNSSNPAAIRAEIDRTRHRMDETIDALGDRFKGRHLVDEALHFFRNQTKNGNMNKFKDTLTDSADSAAHSVIDTVKSNPVPVILIGAGVAFYLYNRSQAGTSRHDPSHAEWRRNRHGTATGNDLDWTGPDRNEAGGAQRAGSGAFEAPAPEATQGFGQRVQDQAHAVAEGTREMSTQIADKSQQLYREGREQAAMRIEQHPLQSGLICLALGLLAGIALPTSEKVRHQVGPQARALRRRADTMMASGRQVIRSAAEAARDEAKSQGLTLDSLKAKATHVTKAATDVAKDSVGENDPETAPAGATVGSGTEV